MDLRKVNLFQEAHVGVRGGESCKFQSVFLHSQLLKEHVAFEQSDAALLEFVNAGSTQDGENEHNRTRGGELEIDADVVANMVQHFLREKPAPGQLG